MKYLLITFLRKPNGQIDEQVAISKRVRPADLKTCNVILDFNKKKIDGITVPKYKEWIKIYNFQ